MGTKDSAESGVNNNMGLTHALFLGYDTDSRFVFTTLIRDIDNTVS